MQNFRYLDGVTTLTLDRDACIGCGMCTLVCPHGVFRMDNKCARLADQDGCMECGACALNCPSEAIRVNPGVGCAEYIIKSWISRSKGSTDCGTASCC